MSRSEQAAIAGLGALAALILLSGSGRGEEQPTGINAAFDTTVNGQELVVNASASTPGDGGSDIVAYDWTLTFPAGGTEVASGVSATFEMHHSGEHQIELTVTDDAGNTDTQIRTAEANIDPGEPHATFTAQTNSGAIDVDASGSTPSNIADEIVQYDWTVTDPDGVDRDGSGVTESFDAGLLGDYEIHLEVTDDEELTDTSTATVTVEEQNIPSQNTTDLIIGYDEDQWLNYRLHIDGDPSEKYDDGHRFYAWEGNWDAEEVYEPQGTYILEGRTGTNDPSGPMHGDAFVWDNDDGVGILGWEFDVPQGTEDKVYLEVNGVEVGFDQFPAVDDDNIKVDECSTNDDCPGDKVCVNGECREETTGEAGIRHGMYEGSLGGGDGMPSELVDDANSADTVVSSMGQLQSAVDSASYGEVIYVQGSISGGLSVDTGGVTIAGNRGVGNDGRWTNAYFEQNAPDLTLAGLSMDAGGGTGGDINSSGLEMFNCLLENSTSFNGALGWNTRDTGATFSHCTFRNWGKYGLQMRYNWHNEANKVTIQYCDMYDLGQHMVQGGYSWIHFKDNHCHGSLNHQVDHILEVRSGKSDAPVDCGDESGNAIVEHNLNEANGSSGAKSGLVRVRGVPTDGVWVRKNESPGNTPSEGGCHSNGTHGGWGEQLVMQPSASGNSLENVIIEDNVT